MRKSTSWLAAAALIGFGVSPLSAQYELSLGYGVEASRLTNWSRSIGGANPLPRTYGASTFTAALGYRPSERYVVRARFNAGERAIDYGRLVDGPGFLDTRQTAVSVGGALEGLYYVRPWVSVGGGIGYNHLNPRVMDVSRRSVGTTRAILRDAGLRSHLVGHLAAEFHAGILTLRVAPTVSLSRAYGDGTFRGSTETVRGNWLGLRASVGTSIPFGKTRYPRPTSVDSLLDRELAGFRARSPRWGLGIAASNTITVLEPGGADDGRGLMPTRWRLGPLATYRLNPDWHLRASIGLNRFGGTTEGDAPCPQVDVDFVGVDATVGMERRIWRSLSLVGEVGVLQTSGRTMRTTRTSDGQFPELPQGGNAPIATYMALASAQLKWQAGERLSLGGHVESTLSRPFGDERHPFFAPNGRRPERWLGVGLNAEWMLVRD